MTLYRGMDRVALDAAYNNSAAVTNSGELLADFQKRSDGVRAEHNRYLDLRYGPAERNRIDYFPAACPGPVLVFIHGGYWQMRAKENFSFLARGPLAHGIHVALVGYTLAPAIGLAGICDEVNAALSWVGSHAAGYGGDPDRVFVSGWSAGGHLTAMSLAHHAVKGGLAISGIYDLTPIQLCYVNDKLELSDADVRSLSPLLQPTQSSKPLLITYGEAELPELQRQSTTYASARSAAGMPGRLESMPGHNHFTILEELASPAGQLTQLLVELIKT